MPVSLNGPATQRKDDGTFRALVSSMETLMVMVALLVAGLFVMPVWPYSTKWGYTPTGACGVIALTMAALVVVGRL